MPSHQTATRLSHSFCAERTRGLPSPPCGGFRFQLTRSTPSKYLLLQCNLDIKTLPELGLLGNSKVVLHVLIVSLPRVFMKSPQEIGRQEHFQPVPRIVSRELERGGSSLALSVLHNSRSDPLSCSVPVLGSA